HHQMNGIDPDSKFFRDDLTQRGANILADLDLAGVARDLALLADVNPSADFLGRGAAKTPAAPLAGRLHRNDLTRHKAHQDSPAQSLKEFPAIPFQAKMGIVIKLVALRLERHFQKILVTHRAPPFIVAAAFWTAKTIRE